MWNMTGSSSIAISTPFSSLGLAEAVWIFLREALYWGNTLALVDISQKVFAYETLQMLYTA